MKLKELNIILSFLSHIIKDEQLNPEHENYCGFVNIGHGLYQGDSIGESQLAEGFESFVYQWQNNAEFKRQITGILKNENIKMQKVSLTETIFELIKKTKPL